MSNKSERIKTSRFPMPKSIEEMLGVAETMLRQGNVAKLEFLVEERVIRVSEKVADEVPLEEDVGWDEALQNVSEMEEYYSPEAESFQVVVDMMHLMAHRQCFATQWVASSKGRHLLEEWLELDERGMPGGLGQLMGVPVTELKDLPNETLLLCGSKYPNAGPEEITFAVKTNIELGNTHVQHSTTHDSGRDNPSGVSSAVGALEAATSGLRLPKW